MHSVENSEPLIGAQEMETPYWAQSQLDASRAGIGAVARGAPRTAALLVGWSWRAAPRWTLLAVALQLATAVATTLGLLSTVDVFTNLLAAGRTPQRVVDALPARGPAVGERVRAGPARAADRGARPGRALLGAGRRRAGRVRRPRLH